MVSVWGLVIGVLLVASGASAVRRPEGFGRLGDRFEPGESPERRADFERRARLAVVLGLFMMVASALL